MRVTVFPQVSARFVELDIPMCSDFEFDGVCVELNARVEEDHAFAAIWCTAEVVVDDEISTGDRDAGSRTSPSLIQTADMDYVVPQSLPVPHELIVEAIDRIDAALQRAAAVLRWRFRVFGTDSPFGEPSCWLALDSGEAIKLQTVGKAAFGDDRAVVTGEGWISLPDLIGSGLEEPIGHQLVREAWNLRLSNPRGSLIIGVAAAEVGLKRLIGDLVPVVRALLDDLPAPPLVKLMKHSLRELPIRADVSPAQRCPRALFKVIDAAVQDRNVVVHRGAMPSMPLYQTLQSVREFLYLLDLYGGHEWAAAHLTDDTLAAIGRPRT